MIINEDYIRKFTEENLWQLDKQDVQRLATTLKIEFNKNDTKDSLLTKIKRHANFDLMQVYDMYTAKIKEINNTLDSLNKDYLKLEDENKDKTLTITSLLEDKRGLTAELADNRAKTTELQNKINDLHQVEVDYTSLKEEREKLKEEIRDNKSEISILNTKIESITNERSKLEKELLDNKELLNITNEKLGEAISELAVLSNTIENLKETNAKLSLDNSSYIEALNNIKEERSNKELEYKKSIIDLERELEIKFNKKLEEALAGIKVKH